MPAVPVRSARNFNPPGRSNHNASSADRTGYFLVPVQEPPAPPAPLVPLQELGAGACCLFSVPPAPLLLPVHELFCAFEQPATTTPASSAARPKPAITFFKSARSMQFHLPSDRLNTTHSYITTSGMNLSRDNPECMETIVYNLVLRYGKNETGRLLKKVQVQGARRTGD